MQIAEFVEAYKPTLILPTNGGRLL